MGDGGVVNIVFAVLAETSPGSQVRAVGSLEELGRWQPEGGYALTTDVNTYPKWAATIRLPFRSVQRVEYKFVIVRSDGEIQWEDCPNRFLPASVAPANGSPVVLLTARFGQLAPSTGLTPPPSLATLDREDTISHMVLGLPLSASSPDAEPPKAPSDLPPKEDAPTAATSSSGNPGDAGVEVCFETICNETQPGDLVVVVGSVDVLGRWQPSDGLQLDTSASQFPQWSGTARLQGSSPFRLEWKVAIVRASGETSWEPGPNRSTTLTDQSDVECWVVKSQFGGSWQRPQVRRRRPAVVMQRSVTHIGTSIGDVIRGSPSAREAPATSSSSLSFGDQPTHRRCNSMSLLCSEPAGQDAAPDACLQADGGFSRRSSGVTEDQFLMLRLADVPAQVTHKARKLRVEVVFKGGDRRKMDFEPDEGRWSLRLKDAAIQDGLYVFHFLVDGVRVASKAHPVFGDFNAALVSDSLRRYVAARENKVLVSRSLSKERVVCPNGLDKLDTKSSCSSKMSGYTPREVNTPGTRTGQMARPRSHAGLLNASGDGDSEDECAMPAKAVGQNVQSRTGQATFEARIFEGLFDRELRLRLDGYVLPQVPECATNGHPPRCLRLWAGAKRIGKQHGVCEDAYFYDERSAGVADGVGCMVQFASYGVNAAAYSAELMEHARQALLPNGTAAKVEFCEASGIEAMDGAQRRAKAAVSAAADGAQAFGASTIVVLTVEGRVLGAANLGDSGFALLRRGPGGMQIVKMSNEQQHSWNCPYQLTRLPPALARRFPKLMPDTAADSEGYLLPVQEGDLILLFTDGLRDNLFDREVLDIADRALSPAFGEMLGMSLDHCTPPERVATALALAAQARSLDPVAKVPFGESSRKQGVGYQGGKQDDITVVAAWVMPDEIPEKEIEARKALIAASLQAAEAAALEAEAKAKAAEAAALEAKTKAAEAALEAEAKAKAAALEAEAKAAAESKEISAVAAPSKVEAEAALGAAENSELESLALAPSRSPSLTMLVSVEEPVMIQFGPRILEDSVASGNSHQLSETVGGAEQGRAIAAGIGCSFFSLSTAASSFRSTGATENTSFLCEAVANNTTVASQLSSSTVHNSAGPASRLRAFEPTPRKSALHPTPETPRADFRPLSRTVENGQFQKKRSRR